MLAAPAWPITSLFRAGTRRTALEPTEETPRGADHAQKKCCGTCTLSPARSRYNPLFPRRCRLFTAIAAERTNL